jgi:transcriptional regulator with XRE-family HTH domain
MPFGKKNKNMAESKEKVIEIIGSKIRETRINKGLSMEKVAHLSGLSYSQVIRIENAKINTSIYQLYLISKALEVTMGEICDI